MASGEAGQLVDGLAAHAQAHQHRRELGGRRLAVHHRAHRPVRLVHGQRAALDDRGQGRVEPARSSDDRRRAWPMPPFTSSERAGSPGSAMPAVANDPAGVVEP